jgi:6-phosphogluconolactonase
MIRRLGLSCAFLVACSGNAKQSTIDASLATDAQAFDARASDAGPAVARLMYVSTGGGNELRVVQLQADGMMLAMPGMTVNLGGSTGAMAYARSTRRLFVGVGQDIATLALDDAGAPSLSAMTVGTGTPVYLEVAKNETILVSAYFGLDQLKTHDISVAPPHPLLDTKSSAEEPHLAKVGPGGLVYVPHRSGDTVQWYSLSNLGALSFVGELAAEVGVGPRHLTFAPDQSHAYLINEMGDSISTHTVASDGSLTRVETISTIPLGADADSNNCADVHITPNGKYLYGSNRGHDSIAMFSIGADGRLTSLGTVPTETTPREFDMSPDGRFVVVAGQGNGFLQSYRVEDEGTLTSVDRLDLGNDPRWVIID